METKSCDCCFFIVLNQLHYGSNFSYFRVILGFERTVLELWWSHPKSLSSYFWLITHTLTIKHFINWYDICVLLSHIFILFESSFWTLKFLTNAKLLWSPNKCLISVNALFRKAIKPALQLVLWSCDHERQT